MTLLLSVVIKVAVLTLCALAATAMLRKRSAAMRHWVLATTIICCFCVPAVELLLPRWSIPFPAAWLTSSTTSSLRLSSVPLDSRMALPSPAGTASDVRTGGLPSPASIVGAFWVGGALIGLTALGVGLVRLRSLAARSEALSTGLWRDVADQISSRHAIRQPVRLLSCPHPTMLATWGHLHPTILLPEGAEDWTEERVRIVLHHELAHVVRGDWAVAMMASVLKAVYWFNPFLWIACRRLQHEGERACDDVVLASGISAPAYATHLLDVARETAQRRHPWSPAIAIAHSSMLEGRVRAMLNAHLDREPLTILMRSITVAAIGAIAVSVGVVTLSGSTDPIVAPEVRLMPSPSPSASPASAPAAQTPVKGGAIEGVLYDQFGGLLPGASVRLTPLATGSSQTSATDRGGAFAFTNLAAGDYEVVTDLPGFIAVTILVHAEPGTTVRRHITLPIGTLQETIHVTCGAGDLRPSRPTAPSSSASPGPSQGRPASPQGTAPKIPATFTGGIGGQIKVPLKISHTNPVCPTGVAPASTVVRLAGRVGIDGLFTDLRDVSNAPAPYVASATDATRQWVFTPTLLNGAPIEVNINVTVSYSWSN